MLLLVVEGVDNQSHAFSFCSTRRVVNFELRVKPNKHDDSTRGHILGSSYSSPFPLLTCVLHIGAQFDSWCGRCYTSACMVHPRIRRPLFSASARGSREQSLSKEERQLLPQLLELLRSGALSSLLQSSGVTAVDTVSSQQPQVSPPKVQTQKPTKPSRGQGPPFPLNQPQEASWKPVNRVLATGPPREGQAFKRGMGSADHRICSTSKFIGALCLSGFKFGSSESNNRFEKHLPVSYFVAIKH